VNAAYYRGSTAPDKQYSKAKAGLMNWTVARGRAYNFVEPSLPDESDAEIKLLSGRHAPVVFG
jgi:hypothetical protein